MMCKGLADKSDSDNSSEEDKYGNGGMTLGTVMSSGGTSGSRGCIGRESRGRGGMCRMSSSRGRVTI